MGPAVGASPDDIEMSEEELDAFADASIDPALEAAARKQALEAVKERIRRANTDEDGKIRIAKRLKGGRSKREGQRG